MPDETPASVEEQPVEQGGTQQPADEGTQTLDLSKLTDEQFNELIARLPEDKLASLPAVERKLQSMKDRESARIERKYQERMQSLAEQRRREAEDAELAALEEDEDYEGIGKKALEQKARERQLSEAARLVTSEVDNRIRNHPKFKSLGEDTIDGIYERVKKEGGTVAEFAAALADEVRDREVKAATEDIRKSIRADVEAMLQERGVLSRSKDEDEGNAPIGAVSRATGATGMTYEKYLALPDAEFEALPDEIHTRMLAEATRRR